MQIHSRTYGDFVTVSTPWVSHGFRGRGPVTHHVSHDWQCSLCGYSVSASGYFDPRPHMDAHTERGHSACEFCGTVLRNCKDGSPRQHPFNRCPGKNPGHRRVLAFEKDVRLERLECLNECADSTAVDRQLRQPLLSAQPYREAVRKTIGDRA